MHLDPQGPEQQQTLDQQKARHGQARFLSPRPGYLVLRRWAALS